MQILDLLLQITNVVNLIGIAISMTRQMVHLMVMLNCTDFAGNGLKCLFMRDHVEAAMKYFMSG